MHIERAQLLNLQTYGTETVINYETLLYILRYCGHMVINVYDLYVIDVVR